MVDKKLAKSQKIQRILHCLDHPPVNVSELRTYCLSEYGLVTNQIRERAWPILLDIDTANIPDHIGLIQTHPERQQVERDVERSLWKFTESDPELLVQKRKELLNIILAVLSSHPTLKYFQGYHDIGSVFLMVTNESLAFALLEKLSLFHIRDALRPNLDYIIAYLDHLVPLLSMIDPTISRFLVESHVQPFFALSWVLTWFAHNLDDIVVVARLFDVFLSTSPLMPIYVSAAVIKAVRSGLLSQECEYSAVHGFLVPAPANAIAHSTKAKDTSDSSDKKDKKIKTDLTSDKTNNNDTSKNNDTDTDNLQTNNKSNKRKNKNNKNSNNNNNNNNKKDTDNASNDTNEEDTHTTTHTDSDSDTPKSTKLYSNRTLEIIIKQALQWYYQIPPRSLMATARTSLPNDSAPKNYPFTWLQMGFSATVQFKWFMFKHFKKPVSTLFIYFVIVPISVVILYFYNKYK